MHTHAVSCKIVRLGPYFSNDRGLFQNFTVRGHELLL